jgi:hypothetical protein
MFTQGNTLFGGNRVKYRLLLCSLCLITTLVWSSATMAQTPPTSTDKTANENKAPVVVAQVKMELQGEFTYRFSAKNSTTAAPTPLPTPTGGVVALPLPADLKADDAELEIYDNTRGNMARVRVDTKTPVSVGESSFKYVQAVYVPVRAQGKAVTNVQVVLTSADKKYQETSLLKPSDNGVARFENVPMTEPVTITVSFGANPTKSVTETIPKGHSADGHHREAITVEWADVKTVATSLATPSSPSAETSTPNPAPTTVPAPTPAPQNGSNNLISTLLGLLVVAGIGYGIWRAYNNGRVTEVLSKLGIQTEANVAPEPAANPFQKPQMPPIQPITEGTADPFSGQGGGFIPVGAPAPLPVSNVPRLVGAMGTYQGSIFPLNGTSTVIGRDPANPVALPNDTNSSRRHATLENSGGQFLITDHGSSNGTFVNGVKIQSGIPHPVRPGDEIQIGMTRFRLEV